ncbi:ATP-binding protein [Pseudarthrobacter sp. H3Y2-7]|uniref:ATP-binding protein n=1 Tax=Pseudarthrobacter naphthalenicus TaxID=3031328 RepID=UPI0023AFF39E|nr:ATP-binding protein [Pseudarthrobacter sp. H3Y2-7]MDE8669960.1 ATP-binding protein [Pseudarthrobacter sp. H3Y2-7]
MDPALNPFNPGSGVRPPELVGRDGEIDAFDLLVARSKSNTVGDRGMVLSGLRGVGKTVLLNVFAEHARRNDWLVIQVEAQPGEAGKKATRAKLARELELGARRLRGKPAWSFLQDAMAGIGNISASLGVTGVSASITTKHQGRADSGNLDIDLEELVEDLSLAMRKARAGFGLFIDEMQDLDEELLTVLLSVQHLAGQRGWPFYIIGAGLPNLPGKISEARTYGERLFLYRTIGQVNEEAASEALALPISRLGASLAPDALSLLLSAANGYPFFLQVYGRSVWEAASEKVISAEDAQVAVRLGTSDLDHGFFEARWQRATNAERLYLRAMAQDGDSPSSTGEIAGRLGKSTTKLAVIRSRLIAKGVVYAPEYGSIQFTVPGMAGFIARQGED